MSKQHYVVERDYTYGWDIGFHDINDQDFQVPALFESEEEAEKEITSYLAECEDAIKEGHMDGPNEERDDLRIRVATEEEINLNKKGKA